MRRILAVAMAALLVGCGGQSSDEAASGTEPAASSTGVAEALQFEAPLISGGELDASTLAGRPVVFWFWSPY